MPAQNQQMPAPYQGHREQPNAVHAEYAKRPGASIGQPRAPQLPLDQHGRIAAQPRTEEDHLEIPAFLRRQSN
jgi:cell division protein FtsZ